MMRRATWLLMIALAFLVVLGGCATARTVALVAVAPINWKSSIGHGELRLEWPRGDFTDYGPNHLYTVDDQWRHTMTEPQGPRK